MSRKGHNPKSWRPGKQTKLQSRLRATIKATPVLSCLILLLLSCYQEPSYCVNVCFLSRFSSEFGGWRRTLVLATSRFGPRVSIFGASCPTSFFYAVRFSVSVCTRAICVGCVGNVAWTTSVATAGEHLVHRVSYWERDVFPWPRPSHGPSSRSFTGCIRKRIDESMVFPMQC